MMQVQHANDYLKALGFVSIAYAWIKVLEVSFKDYDQNKNFYEDKIQTANFYFEKSFTKSESHYKTATSGSEYIMNLNLINMSHYDTNLDKNEANYVPLSPLTFLERAKDIYPKYEAVVYEE